MTSVRCSRAARLLLPLLLSLAACGHQQRVPPPRVKPSWIPSPNRSHPNLIYVTGSCRGISRRELARRCAIADAKLQLRKALKRSALRFQSSYVEDEHVETRGGADSSSKRRFDWWVLVAYPRSPASSAPAACGAQTQREQRLLTRWRALDEKSQDALLTLLERMVSPPAPAP